MTRYRTDIGVRGPLTVWIRYLNLRPFCWKLHFLGWLLPAQHFQCQIQIKISLFADTNEILENFLKISEVEMDVI